MDKRIIRLEKRKLRMMAMARWRKRKKERVKVRVSVARVVERGRRGGEANKTQGCVPAGNHASG